MSTDYDAVAEEYKRSKLAPWRTYLERYSLLNLLGEVRGKSVLDLACGEGFYSRLVRERGAGRVVGVDWSSGMIGLAIAAEKKSPLGPVAGWLPGHEEVRLREERAGENSSPAPPQFIRFSRMAVHLISTNRVVAQFRSGHRPIPVLFECYRIRTDSGMPRLGIRFSTSHLMMPSTR